RLRPRFLHAARRREQARKPENQRCAPPHVHLSATLTPLLVATVFLPERCAQFRVRLLHRRLADLPRDDVIVLAVRDVGRDRATAGAASADRAATDAALLARRRAFLAVARAALAVAGPGRLEAAFALRLSAGLVITGATCVAASATAAIPRFALGFLVAGCAAACACRRAILCDVRLRRAHGRIESAESLVEAS